MHIYRWDLDKTYLETDFDSFRGLVRAATEGAESKRAVPGATALMRALGRTGEARVFILSGSPEQMRAVLEEKLRIDGVQFESLVLKDNLGNLRRGRLRAIRGQLGYKLPVLFQTRVGLGRAVRETLFGDDAEVDALVYSIYADAVAGRLSVAEVSRIMETAGAYPDRIEAALEFMSELSPADPVESIFIRLARAAPTERFAPLGSRVVPVHSWWQAALVLGVRGHIGADDLGAVLEEVRTAGELDDWAIAGLSQDIVRRGHVAPGAAAALLEAAGLSAAVLRAVSRLGTLSPPQPHPSPRGAEYIALVRQWGHRPS